MTICLTVALLFVTSGINRAEAAIAFRAATSVDQQTSASSCTINKPTGTLPGDVMLAAFQFDTGSAVTPPSGWNFIVRTDDATHSMSVISYYQVAGASEPASYTWTLAPMSGWCTGGIQSYAGVSTSTPIDVAGGQSGTSNSPTTPSLTTTADSDWLIGVWAVWNSNVTINLPAGMTSRINFTGASPQRQADQSLGTAGATSTRVATTSQTAGSWIAQAITIKSASALGSFSLSGTVSPSASGSGTTLSLSGAATATVTVDSLGNYSFGNLVNGTYTVTPSKTGYTFSPPSQTVTISGSPVSGVNFTATPILLLSANAGSPVSGNEGQVLIFNGSASGGNPPYTYSWSFGDGGSASTAVASYAFLNAGTYTVTLKVTDSSSNSAQSSLTATIADVPPVISGLSSVSGYTGVAVSFTASASTPSPKDNAAGFSYFWTFGDGSTSTLQNPVYVYAAPGSYIVTVQATSNYDGASSSASIPAFIVNPSPLIANAGGPYNGYLNTNIRFSGSGSGGIPPYSYSWRFGDGATSSSQNPSHAYTAARSYSVSLTVTDFTGASATQMTQALITVASPLVVSAAGPYSGNVNAAISFSGSASGGVTPYSYAWVFGDGGSSSAQNPSHIYANTGTFTAVLTVTDSASTQASSQATVTVTSTNPIRPQPTTLNTASSQYRNLVAAFPLWITSPTAAALDLVQGLSGSPSHIIVQTDPIMGNVFSSNGGSHFTVPYNTILDFAYPNDTAQPFTISAWVNISISSLSLTTDDNPANMYIVTFDANSLAAAYPGYGFGAAATPAANGPITTEFDVDGHAAQQTMFGHKVINDGQWHLLVVTYTPASSTALPTSMAQIYVDGVLDSTNNAMAELESPTRVPPSELLNPFAMYIGSDDDGQSNPWQGMFCDLRFYDVALSPAEIAAMYAPATRWELYQVQ